MAIYKKSYQEIVEDILIDLTGGIVNEEHEFLPGQKEYSLDNTPVKTISSVRGMVNGEKYEFTGHDYKLDVDAKKLAWGSKSTIPDSNTKFYVDYYPENASSPITDRNIGSVTRTLVEAFGREVATLYSQLDLVYQNAFIDTATGKSLDFLVEILDIQRIKAGRAVGKVTFSRNTPAPTDITIPLGTLITDGSKNNNKYKTTEEKVLRQGQTSIEAPIQAEEAEEEVEEKDLQPKVITIMPKPILGIEKVINEAAPVIGTKDETDEQLRARAKTILKATGKSTLEAITLAIHETGLVNKLVVNDLSKSSPGKVEVIVDTESLESNDTEKLQQAIKQSKAAGVFVELKSTTKVYIKVKLKLTTTETSPGNQELSDIKKDIQLKVKNYLNSLAPGESVLSDKIISIAMSNPKVYTAKIEDMTAKANGEELKRVLANYDVLTTPLERAVADKENPVEIGEIKGKEAAALPEEGLPAVFRVFADIILEVEIAKDSPLLPDQVQAICNSKAAAYLAELIEGESVSISDFTSSISSLKYNIKDKCIKLIHSQDGLVVELKGAGDSDKIRKGEKIEIKNIKVDVTRKVTVQVV